MTDQLKFDDTLQINGNKLTKKYVESLSKQERLDLINPIFQLLRQVGWLYPDNTNKINKSWKALLDFQPDLTTDSLFNNSSLATDICKFFCHTFYNATEPGKPTLLDNFNNDEILKKMIFNRLGLGWLDADEKGPGVNESFNLTYKQFVVQSQRSMRLVNATSMFKPSIAKYMALKYSSEEDTIFDYSIGFGGRLLGTMAANRKYIGTDPLTKLEVESMAEYLKFNKNNYTLVHSGSENYRSKENSIDLCYSSPPYISQEHYSDDTTQAYNNGEDYFYNIYWKQTLENAKYMLKPGKIFGLNILDKYSKMIEMTKKQFGEPIEIIKLRTIRSHLSKEKGIEKFEPIFIFHNQK